MFVFVRVPESQSPKHHGNFFQKKPCLVPHISETIELNQKRLKNLLTNFFGSFQIRKDPMSDIGTLIDGLYFTSIVVYRITSHTLW